MFREVAENIKLLPERNLLMKGIFSRVGGDTDVVEYAHAERVAGNAKLSGWKLQNLVLEGITSSSISPLRIWTYIGLLVVGASPSYGTWMIIDTLAFGNAVGDYLSFLASILFLGRVQLIGIGVLGEYTGRTYVEAKHRPRYIKKINKSNGEVNE